MVTSVGSLNLPPSVQAVNKARETARAEKAQARQDEVSVSKEAQELLAAQQQAQDTREALSSQQEERLTRDHQDIGRFL